jgi:hypothetical protein
MAGLLLFGVTSISAAASPTLTGVVPRGGQRGTEVVFTLAGDRLDDAKDILFYDPGFTVVKLEPANNQVKATVRIAADCALGEHALRIRTATGLSELHTLSVGALPCVDEKEPNNDFTAPQPIPLNVTVHGTITPEDVDYFQIEAKKGQRIAVEIEAMRLGSALFDPYVAILDSKRFELAASDDAPLLGRDGAFSIIAPADGKYVVQVRESSYGGAGNFHYRLHVGTFARPMAVVPAGGKLGEEVEVRFLGDASGEQRRKVKLPTMMPAGKFGLYLEDEGGVSPSPIPFRLSESGNVMEAEPNDDHAHATPGQLPCAFNGVIDKPGDVDHFRFTAKQGETYDVHCHARKLGSPLDPVMTLAPLNGGAIVANDDFNGSPDSYFRFTCPKDGEYVLAVFDHLRAGGPTYFYRVEFTAVKPHLTLGIPVVNIYSPQERTTVSVPRGNRYATMVSVTRADFGGDLILDAADLPAGVKMVAENPVASMTQVPAVFEAADDAPLAGALVRIHGRPVDEKLKVPSSFSQVLDLVRDPNLAPFWRYHADRLAVSVTQAVPFTLEIVEPKAPLARAGTMNLKVVAKRQPGYKAAITVTPLYNPPGVGSATAVTIPENQTEVLLPLNANVNTPVRKWKYVVNGTAEVPGGPVMVSSPMATLETAPPFVAFTLERAMVEQGKATTMHGKVQPLAPFAGPAKVKLVGLPPKVTAPEVEITAETKEFDLPLTVEPTATAGQYRNLFCQVTVTVNGEPVTHSAGSSELRIDVPIAPKVAAAPAAPAAPQPAKPAEKRLSRLEQLRQEQEAREKAAKEKKD